MDNQSTKLASKVKKNCYKCRLIDKRLESQRMAPLPIERLKMAPVFNITSLDLFGPYTIKDCVKKRVHMKVWGIVFTCLVTRSVFIDITENYGTDSFLQTLRKFIAIRGYPSEIYSDQGSQLVSAAKDIAYIVNNWKSVQKFCCDKKIL